MGRLGILKCAMLTPLFLSFDGLRRERVLASKQQRGGRFRNTCGVGTSPNGPALSVIGDYFLGDEGRVPGAPLPFDQPQAHWQRPTDAKLRATWLGHSTVLLEMGGKRVLTDPVFGERASPFGFAGPKRFHPVPALLSELPPLDAVLLSHDHYDHLCADTMHALAKMAVPVVTALGVGALLEGLGMNPAQVTELDWHESAVVAGLRFTATPSQHFSGRALGQQNKTLWASWVVESDARKVFFSGDTGLTPEFLDIGNTHGPFDLVMLEIGAYHEAWGSIHLGPKNALEAYRMLKGKALLPVHWSTFNLALHDWNEPAETLVQLAAPGGERVLTPRLGQVFEPERVEAMNLWWRNEQRKRR
jgi:L-ascorbate metabolism protein UlaG (beta-lactamase superfamily)